MALSNLDKNHVDGLLLSLKGNDNQIANTIEAVKANHADYAQLKLISRQIEMLKQEALNIINNSISQSELHQISKSFKLTSGNNYYLYEKQLNVTTSTSKITSPTKITSTTKYFSLISPEEWGEPHLNKNEIKYLGKYLYDLTNNL
jgi:hypothetical protein